MNESYLTDKNGELWPHDCIIEWDISKNGPMKLWSIDSKERVWWRCTSSECGNTHEWEDIISKRTYVFSKCPVCSNYEMCPCLCNLTKLKNEKK